MVFKKFARLHLNAVALYFARRLVLHGSAFDLDTFRFDLCRLNSIAQETFKRLNYTTKRLRNT